ncbi:hypothetical protein SLNWT_1015 [Streptomyces albus]|uniref:Uncharacterized protein n=1 Tax=Streptomyces albus (strain ATCC 21838 / DSM 41398 / FERM P-419 / JCM 4703 / NBRC 107858) TaxID=1081613 RepID=A0A0B5ERL6_STRA4|nr:hypothetical protein SLNWT_1015 [Streptomyces albus]AOU75707.1 hypothetical protein SLNHY_1016 [Streptomyces albus]AYN31508.1 hypothetical protein DUI70_1005 [Streptomyces albus]
MRRGRFRASAVQRAAPPPGLRPLSGAYGGRGEPPRKRRSDPAALDAVSGRCAHAEPARSAGAGRVLRR